MTSKSTSRPATARPLYETRPGSTNLVKATLDEPLKQVAQGIWQSDGTSNSYLSTTADSDVVINTGLVTEGHIHRRSHAQAFAAA
jgi:hypothetical protein